MDAACVFCGCTEENACVVVVAEQTPAFQRVLQAAAKRARREVPEFIGCSWFETDPPVCSAPACVGKYTEQLVKTLSP